ncbi:NAD(P)H-binding protein [Parafrankia sp. FMc2]|uniref:NAD(P)H-binding protein n=1 Tax=Parafrankia sp. FMc2 TaxID=3233196 RepID=UPI003B5875BB
MILATGATGATGTVGREVVRLLVARGAAVRAMTRNPANVPASLGVDIRGCRTCWADRGRYEEHA